MRATIDRTLAALGAVGAPPTWVLENHDVTRLPTRYGGGEVGRAGRGPPRCCCSACRARRSLYQGQELGLEEVDLPDEVRQDPVFLRTNGARKGRDGCRVPIPWTTEPPASASPTASPGCRCRRTGARSASRPSRTRRTRRSSSYRSRARLRPRGDGFAWHDSPPGTLVFERGDLVCAVNVDAAELRAARG